MTRLDRSYPLTYLVPFLVLFGVFFALPVVASFVLAFTDWDLSRLWSPQFNGWDNFGALFDDEYFALALGNTLLFAVATTVGKVAFGLGLALILSRPLRGRDFWRGLFFLPCVLSMVVVGLVFQSLLRYDGLVNRYLVVPFFGEAVDWLGSPATALWSTIVAEIWRWSGFTMAIFVAGIQGISKEYYEAAAVDGVGVWAKFRTITWPLLAPAATVVVTISVIGGLKVFEQVYVMTNGGPGNASQVLGTFVYNAFSQGRLGLSTAMGLSLFVLVAGLSWLMNRFLRSREVEA